MPCLATGLIAMTGRKKGLLVWCLLLRGKELDGVRDGAAPATATTAAAAAAGGGGGMVAPHANSGAGPGRQMVGSAMGDRVLGLPDTANTAIIKFMSASSSRVGRAKLAVSGGGASSLLTPERMAGSEMSEGLGRGGRGHPTVVCEAQIPTTACPCPCQAH
jgi:hypothetical protein